MKIVGLNNIKVGQVYEEFHDNKSVGKFTVKSEPCMVRVGMTDYRKFAVTMRIRTSSGATREISVSDIGVIPYLQDGTWNNNNHIEECKDLRVCQCRTCTNYRETKH